MKILLILPFQEKMIDARSITSWASRLAHQFLGLGKTNHFPSLSLLMLAAVTPSEFEVKVIDERIEQIDFDEPAVLVGISVVTRSALRAYEIAGEFRRRGVKVVLGGIHPSAMPKEAMQHADAVVLGEGEGIWPEVLRDFRFGNLQPIYRGRAQLDLDALPFPRRELIRHPEMYVTTKVVSATRGCPNSCTFCAAGIGLIKKYRKRSVGNVIEELQQVPGTITDFVDDNMGWDTEYLKALMRAMIPLRLRWSTSVCMNALEDQELVDLAAESGCYSMGVGFESLSPKVLASVRKDKANRPERYAACIRRVQEAGMVAWGEFIVGFDEDTKQTFRDLIEFVRATNLEIFGLGILIPYPGTIIYKQYKREGRLLNENWNLYETADGPCVYIPKQMTIEELIDGYLEVRDELFAWKSLLGRLVRSKSFFSFGTLVALHIGNQVHTSLVPQKARAQEYKESLHP